MTVAVAGRAAEGRDAEAPEGTAAVEAPERERALYSFRLSVEEQKYCCGIRKVEPLGRALAGLDAWVTGLRRELAETRSGVALCSTASAGGTAQEGGPSSKVKHCGSEAASRTLPQLSPVAM